MATTNFVGYSGTVGISGYPIGISASSSMQLGPIMDSNGTGENIQVSVPMEELSKIAKGESKERIQDEVISIIAERIADTVMEDQEKEIDMITKNIDLSALMERVKEELISQIKDKMIDDIK